ncbi:uncharacterized protein LOC129220882 [Uloborus diversus]|uniref:uncharacterized protein LOC129220882 n=1 Tax=Uloborus diversus TaxID=327109 RepID=UPI00240A4079|nr:uncharacterized protein LOC129220882 [Uloborus diversus]
MKTVKNFKFVKNIRRKDANEGTSASGYNVKEKEIVPSPRNGKENCDDSLQDFLPSNKMLKMASSFLRNGNEKQGSNSSFEFAEKFSFPPRKQYLQDMIPRTEKFLKILYSLIAKLEDDLKDSNSKEM